MKPSFSFIVYLSFCLLDVMLVFRLRHYSPPGHAFGSNIYIYIYIYAFSRRFYPKRLTVYRLYICIVSMCVPWESNPQPLRC